MSESHLR